MNHYEIIYVQTQPVSDYISYSLCVFNTQMLSLAYIIVATVKIGQMLLQFIAVLSSCWCNYWVSEVMGGG